MGSPLNVDRPAFLIVAGPNGSGKSTAYEVANAEFEDRSFWIVNPDRLSARIAVAEEMTLPDANLQAVTRIEQWLEASIAVHKTIGVETVLSTGKYRRLVDLARAKSYDIWLIYVLLDNPDLNVARVRTRVAKGGHDVPEDRIRSRYQRSLDQMPWFLQQADRAWIYDNSGSSLEQVGLKRDGVLTLDPDAPDELIRRLVR